MKSFLILFNAAALAAGVFFFAPQGCSTRNLPPDPGTPWPEPHAGTFVSGVDTLFFKGDGVTLSWHFADEIPGIGKQGTGTYVFMFGPGEWRYDRAETLRVRTDDQQEATFHLSVSERATKSSITLIRHDLPQSPSATFKKI